MTESFGTNTAASAPRVTAIYRYPVKGLSAEPMPSVEVPAGACIPFDRAYAIENGSGKFDPLAPRHLPKINFLMLMRNERLAALETAFDPETDALTIFRDGKQVARGVLTLPVGRQMIEQFVAAYMADDLSRAPKIVHAGDHHFTDLETQAVHIVNMASVRELSRMAGREIDPLRFRANIVLDGLDPWQEFDWLDRSLGIADAELRIFSRTERCAATNVAPRSGHRDMAVPQLLERHLGHTDFGVYATVKVGGRLQVGDTIDVPAG